MSEDISNNNPKKEFLFALMGIGLFLGIVLLIGISAFLRPAGQHITAEPMIAEPIEATATADEAEATAADATTKTIAADAEQADGKVEATAEDTATAQ